MFLIFIFLVIKVIHEEHWLGEVLSPAGSRQVTSQNFIPSPGKQDKEPGLAHSTKGSADQITQEKHLVDWKVLTNGRG